jgi:hypothetical protein
VPAPQREKSTAPQMSASAAHTLHAIVAGWLVWF